MERKRILILDANTLIDYLECDRTIIKLICRYVGQIYLATPVLNEINEIDEDGCIEIGIKLLGPELEQVMSAAARKGPL
ncbi:MAG TPA: hypothetical protein PLD22_02775, partial [Bacillota bacterium]|nr:hypothetical protein [Bacillota bacterium]